MVYLKCYAFPLLLTLSLFGQLAGQVVETKRYQIPDYFQDATAIQIPLYDYLSILPDGDLMTYEEVSKLPKSAFEAYRGKLKTGEHWLRLDIQGNEKIGQEYYITFSYYLHRMESYVIDDDRITRDSNGILVAPKDKKEALGYFNKVSIQLDSGEKKTIFFKILKTIPSARLEVNLSNTAPVKKFIEKRFLYALIYASVFAAIAIFNLLLFVFTLQRLYLYNFFMIFFIGLHASTYLLTMVWSFQTVASLLIFFTAGIVVSGAKFGDSLLNFSDYHHWLKLAVKGLIYGGGMVMITVLANALLFDYNYYVEYWTTLFLVLLAIATQITWLVGGIFVWRSGDKRGRLFFASAGPFIAGSMFYAFVWFNKTYQFFEFPFEITFVAINIFYGSLCIQILLFSSFVGYQMKQLLDEKLEIQADQANQLEEKVTKRTASLETANKEILDQKDELIYLNKIKDNLLSIVSHDLRNPLLSIKGILDLLSHSMISEKELLDMAPRLHHSIDTTVNLIDNLLYWARSQMDGAKVNATTFDLRDFVERNIQLGKYMRSEKSINLVSDLTSAEIFADPDMIDLIIRNLCTNAVKFTPKNGEIRVNMVKTESDIHIVIKDNGVGISAEMIPHLFAREKPTTSRGTMNEKGYGLGLVLCKEFVEANGGSISVQSEEKKGTTFTVVLPLDH